MPLLLSNQRPPNNQTSNREILAILDDPHGRVRTQLAHRQFVFLPTPLTPLTPETYGLLTRFY